MARRSRNGRSANHSAQITEKSLRPIVNATFGAVGETYFHLLVRHLATLLRVKWAFVSTLQNSNRRRVCLISMWAGNGYARPFEYNTKDTPCENVIGRGMAHYPSGLQKLFPNDRWLIDEGVESYLAIPLFSASREPLGHLGVMDDKPMLDRTDHQTILKIFASRSSTELERINIQQKLTMTNELLAHALKRLRQLSRSNMNTIENEHRTFARELHDNIGSAVNAVNMRLEGFVRQSKNHAIRTSEVEKSISLLRDVSQEIRRLSTRLRPQVLDELGLFAAIKSHIREFGGRTGIQVAITIQMAKEPLPAEAHVHVYRIVQEAFNNIEKHSRAKKAFIGVKKHRNHFLLTIEDDGIGICNRSLLGKKGRSKGLGFTSMRERAHMLGGRADIESADRGGLRIVVKVPLRSNDERLPLT